MKSALVTGGAGFIGSHLVDLLMSEGWNITILDDLSTGTNMPCRACQFVKLDIRKFDGSTKFDAVFHLAAFVNAPISWEAPIACYRTNVEGTLHLLDILKGRCGRFVYAASSSCYGMEPASPDGSRVGDPLDPRSPYAASKAAAEMIVMNNPGINARSCRFFNVYGPRQRADSAYAAVVPKFIEAALEDKPLAIYGDGEQVRDFVYVEDVARALLDAATDDVPYIRNVGSGKATSVNDLGRSICNALGKEFVPEYKPARKGDPTFSLAADCQHRDSLRGIPDTVQWWLKRKGT
jgi:UDP-glucose 4-epimerase